MERNQRTSGRTVGHTFLNRIALYITRTRRTNGPTDGHIRLEASEMSDSRAGTILDRGGGGGAHYGIRNDQKRLANITLRYIFFL